MSARPPSEKPVTIHDAKTNLSRLLARVEEGHEVIIARGSKSIAKIVPLNPPPPKRRTPNRYAHLVPPGADVLSDGFWDPLPADHLGLGDDADPPA